MNDSFEWVSVYGAIRTLPILDSSQDVNMGELQLRGNRRYLASVQFVISV
jgi:hypothetical protein